jgi:superfamily II DNA/RNA helicase
MLDRIGDMLDEANIRYDRLDGTMTREDRARAMQNLKNNKKIEVLIVSTRAGGVGLNLTTASRAYLIDPYWSAAISALCPRSRLIGQESLRRGPSHRSYPPNGSNTACHGHQTHGQRFDRDEAGRDPKEKSRFGQPVAEAYDEEGVDGPEGECSSVNKAGGTLTTQAEELASLFR